MFYFFVGNILVGIEIEYYWLVGGFYFGVQVGDGVDCFEG